jgi:dihydroorotate dehydrogenase
MYRLVFNRLITRFDAETMHKLGFFLLRFALFLPWLRKLVRAVLAPKDGVLTLRAFGHVLDSPLGLAAGFDKDGVGYEQLYALGFGFIEVGTLTGSPQPGNPRPRMFRLIEDEALINRLGFNNGGSQAAIARLSRRRSMPLGVNIGKTKLVPEDHAIEDYTKSATWLGAFADYMVVNVSSPNTPGLRDLQAVELLKPLLLAVQKALREVSPQRIVPLFVKIAPDLANEDIDAVADMALEIGLHGIIATNTTIARSALHTSEQRLSEIGAGGLSGAPLRVRSLEVLRRLQRRVAGRLMLVSVGGVSTAQDVLDRILAGATLVQAYTGFVYGGPRWPSRVRRDLARLLLEHGYRNVVDAIGADVRPSVPGPSTHQAANQ